MTELAEFPDPASPPSPTDIAPAAVPPPDKPPVMLYPPLPPPPPIDCAVKAVELDPLVTIEPALEA